MNIQGDIAALMDIDIFGVAARVTRVGQTVGTKVAGIYDGPRHSFITFRTAEIRDVARVSDECGNSPNIIRKHYREIVTAAAAERYFRIRPAAIAENITDIEEGKKSA